MRAWKYVADLAAPRHLQGGLVAHAAPGLPFLLEEGMEVAFVPPQHDAVRRGRVTSVREDSYGGFAVTFDTVADVRQAGRLAGLRVLARREDLPDEASWAAQDGLVGWQVRDVSAGLVGTVAEVLESPGQLLLSVERPGGGRAVLVPLVDAFVVGLDEEAARIDMALPDGLLEL